MKKIQLNQDKSIQMGIDIGSSKICCAIARIEPSNGEMRLLGIGSSPSSGLKRGTIVHRDKVIAEIEKAVAEAETMADTKVQQAVLSISGEHIRGINTQGAIALYKSGHGPLPAEHEINTQDVLQALDRAKAISLPMDRDILHVLPQEYVIDTMDEIKDPVGMTGRRLEARVHLITVATTAASNLAHCVEELGISVEGLVFQPLASSLSTLDKDEKELGCALVDLGAGTTDIMVYSGGGIRHSAVIPIGASSITNDIAVMLQIGIDEAEEIKLKYASAKASMSSAELDFELPVKNGGVTRRISEHEISRYVEARMLEILQLIAREIFRADIQENITYGVILTGGGSQLRNTVALAEEVLNMRIRIGVPKGISGAVDVAASPLYAAALGLVQWKQHHLEMILERGEQGVSFRGVVNHLSTWFRELF